MKITGHFKMNRCHQSNNIIYMIVALCIYYVLINLLYFLIPSSYINGNEFMEMFFFVFGDMVWIILLFILLSIFVCVTEQNEADVFIVDRNNRKED